MNEVCANSMLLLKVNLILMKKWTYLKNHRRIRLANAPLHSLWNVLFMLNKENIRFELKIADR